MSRLLLNIVEYPGEKQVYISDLNKQGREEVIKQAEDLIQELKTIDGSLQ